MNLFSAATELTDKVRNDIKNKQRGDQLVADLHAHIEAINATSYYEVLSVEELLAKEQLHNIEVMKTKKGYPMHLPRFSPSSSSKSNLELYLKGIKAPVDEQTTYPFQNRWTRNATAVHGAMQKQLLEAEVLLKDPAFRVERLENGLPRWEKNGEKWKVFNHNGVEFVVYGMCDGVLEYKDGSKVGFEYKTKSNSVAQIKQLKEASPAHELQTVAYSLLFGIDEWLITYESVAKDKWTTNEAARPDFKIFYKKVAEYEKKRLLDKWANVAKHINAKELPENDLTKMNSLFFPYKEYMAKLEGEGVE